MRRHEHRAVDRSILAVPGEPGCPFRRLLKEFQSDRLQMHRDGTCQQRGSAVGQQHRVRHRL
jgi:hypothetical protein